MIKCPTFVQRPIAKAQFGLKKHGPDLAFYGGIALIVGGTVAACVATFKAKDVVEEHLDEMDELHKEKENMEEKEYKGKVFKKYLGVGMAMAKLYALPVAMEIAGVILCRKGYRSQKERLAMTASLLNATTAEFKDYRNRVRGKEGEDADLEYRYGIRQEEIERTDEDGNTIVKSERVISEKNHSRFARYFDESCKEWSSYPEYNLGYLQELQCTLTDKLNHDGYLFLNEVYEALGIPKTAEGQFFGWIAGIGKCVDFGIYDLYRGGFRSAQNRRDFVNGYEPVILLDFNIDGNIVNGETVFTDYQRY